jgi:hypothetical protein
LAVAVAAINQRLRSTHRREDREPNQSPGSKIAPGVDRTMVTLVIHYDYGLVQTFIGTMADANHLMGSFGNNTTTVTFTRR